MFSKLKRLFSKLKQLFSNLSTRSQSDAEKFILSKNPQSLADIEYWAKVWSQGSRRFV